jgi:hypothetical protein
VIVLLLIQLACIRALTTPLQKLIKIHLSFYLFPKSSNRANLFYYG